MAINLPTGFFRTTNEPLDVRYLASGLTPYSSVAAANAAIESSVRYIGQFVNINNQLYWYQNGIADGNLVAFAGGGGGGSGTVTSVSVTTANGVSGTVSNPTTTPAISLSLGAITPSSVAATGTVTGSNLSGTNTGDQDLSNLVVKNPTITGATKTKITYDSKGLVTSGSDATTADIADTTDKRYQTDNQKLYNDATSSIQTQLNSKVTGVTASSPITSSGGTSPVISTSMSTNKLIGRSSAGTGSMEEITVGTGLSLSGGTLSSTSTGSGILSGTASGTDTYTVTISGVTAYNNQDAYLIRFTNGNTTDCTLNINSIGAVTLYRNNNGALIGGDIIDGAEMLCIYNSTLSAFQVIGTAPNTLLAYVTNAETSTITKGQAVYAFGGTGDRLKVKLAYNTSDATSASTLGIVLSTSIAANQKGLIIMQGQLDGLSLFPTATWADGDPVFLSATPGGVTKTKQYAPNHLVYLGVVTTASNGGAGRMYVKVQNGYELDELHNVQAQSPNNNDTLYYDNSVSQWKTNSIAGILGYTPANASTAVTSVTGTSPISSSGGTTPAISISQATASTSGYLSSTDWNTFNNKQNAFGSQTGNTFFAAPDGAPGVPSFRQIVAADIPTLNQNTTGSAGSVTNSLTFNNSGSGSSSGVTFNGSAAKTISYNTIGAQASSTNLTSLAALSYASTSFVKMTASGTFSLDTNTYVTSGALSSYVPYTGAVSNVALGTFSLTSDNGAYDTEISPTFVKAKNLTATEFSSMHYDHVEVSNTISMSTMQMNSSGLVFPNGSTQTSAGLTGSGSSGQVSYWNGSTSQAGTSNLFWDSGNNRLGINNASPLYALDVSGTAKSNTVRVDNIGADTFQIFDGGGTKQLYIDSTNQFAFNAASGPIYFGAFGAPTFGRAGFSIPGNVVFVVDAVTARTGFGGGINLIFNSPDALVEIQGKADEKQLSVKGNAGQTSDIAEFKSNGTKTVYVDSTGRLVSTTMAIPTAAPASAIAGSMYIDTTTNFLWVHNGTSWVSTLLT